MDTEKKVQIDIPQQTQNKLGSQMAGLVGSGKGKHLNGRSMQRNRDIYRKIPKGHRDRHVHRDLQRQRHPMDVERQTRILKERMRETKTYRQRDRLREIHLETDQNKDGDTEEHTHKIYTYTEIHKHIQIHICGDTYRPRGCTSRDRQTLGQNTCRPSPSHTLTPTLLPPSIQSRRETHMCLDTLGPQTQPCMLSHRDKYTDISMTRHNTCIKRGEGREGIKVGMGREKKRHSETYIGPYRKRDQLTKRRNVYRRTEQS